MSSRHVLQLAALTLIAAAPAGAQHPVGTVVFSTHIDVPDSLRAKVPIGTAVELQFTAMSDGHRYAIDIATGPSMAMFPNMHVRAVIVPDNDSITAALILPPQLAAMTGGGSGFRVAVPTATLDSVTQAARVMLDSLSHKFGDSISKATPPSFTALGTTAVVAGVPCEEWQTVAKADTMTFCVVPTPAPLRAAKDYMKRALGLQALLDRYPGMAEASRNAFGGRDMTAIRIVVPKAGMRMELVSYSAATPADSMFAMPADLKTVALPALPNMSGASGTPPR